MLKLSRGLVDDMLAHCRSAYPKEACGLLAGSAQLGLAVELYRMSNVEDSPIGYSMDPKEQLRVDKQMRQKGQRLVAIYHSHTASPAYPSSVDVSLAISPEVSYVLVSLKDQAQPDIKSYHIDGTTVRPEEIAITP